MESFGGKSFDKIDFNTLAAKFNSVALGGKNKRVSSLLSNAGRLFSGNKFGNRLGLPGKVKERNYDNLFESNGDKLVNDVTSDQRKGYLKFPNSIAGFANISLGEKLIDLYLEGS